ncbi:MAG: helix-turn-helix transcriptional regulator [Candidatus Pacebacteria bacterium]|nr:helix-turn-helix transcriptional regulator [Candidatus Paceibacterota bacterium]
MVKKKRKELKLTQEELAMRVGVGLRFLRDVEQGKESVRLDKLNLVLRYMGLEVSAVKMRRDDE